MSGRIPQIDLTVHYSLNVSHYVYKLQVSRLICDNAAYFRPVICVFKLAHVLCSPLSQLAVYCADCPIGSTLHAAGIFPGLLAP